MTFLGWVFILLSWACIIFMLIFCFAKIFQKKEMD